MFTGIVHREGSTLWFDDVAVKGPADIPRRRAWGGTLWYCTPSVQPSDLGRLLSEEDMAYGPAPGKVLGVKFRVGQRRRMTVMMGSAWGVSQRDPSAAFRRMQALVAEAMGCGLSVRSSVAGTALQTYLDKFDGQDEAPYICQLPSRFRALAHAALHGGPIAVLSGGAPYATQIDVRRAYLSALYQDFPVYGRDAYGRRVGGWTCSDKPWSKLRTRTGIVDASVRVCMPSDPTGLPPLPVHLAVGAVHATGQLRGVWTIAQIREAEERGEVEVLGVHQAMVALQTAPVFAKLADFFDALPESLGKRLYTRFWGRLGYRGGYVGIAREEPVVGAVPSTSLWWRYEGTALDDPFAPKTYRPDLAAFVAADNHRHVIRTVRQLQPGSIVACHVDAIWTTDVVGAARLSSASETRPGVWKSKRSGELRFFGPGCYIHDGSLAASGYDSNLFGPLTEDSLRGWVKGSTHRRLTLQTRRWTADPSESQQASSRPVDLEMDLAVQPTEGPSVHDPCWSASGWMLEQPVNEERPLEVA